MCRLRLIEPHIDRLLRDVPEVRILNSNWPDTIDFDAEPNLKAVLIGGNKLSRGLTIEGLLVSYYVRETLYYDTLMQMGRWFGYRGQYVDLTRLYSTELLVRCFHDLSTAEEELRRQIARYDRERLTPTNFVPRVRTHPLMAVTQPSKMQAAVELSVNYAGERVQTFRFPTKPSADMQTNLETTRRLLRALGPPHLTEGNKPSWAGVSPDLIIEFLSNFRVDSSESVRPWLSRRLHRQADTQRRIDAVVGPTLLREPSVGRERRGGRISASSGCQTCPLIARSRLRNDPTSLGVITEPNDELLGLSDVDIRAAEEEASDYRYGSLAEAYRRHRDPAEGLLVLYPISAASEEGRNARNRMRLFADPGNASALIAYSISFPFSTTDATVEYVSAPPPSGAA